MNYCTGCGVVIGKVAASASSIAWIGIYVHHRLGQRYIFTMCIIIPRTLALFGLIWESRGICYPRQNGKQKCNNFPIACISHYRFMCTCKHGDMPAHLLFNLVCGDWELLCRRLGSNSVNVHYTLHYNSFIHCHYGKCLDICSYRHDSLHCGVSPTPCGETLHQ